MKQIAAGVLGLLFAVSVNAGWLLLDSPVTTNLYAICHVDADELFVAGAKGVILHYDGDEWIIMDTPVESSLKSISMLNSEEGWAVGVEGAILRYEDGTWHEFPSESEGRMYNAVSVISSNEVYFLSYDFLQGTKLEQWTGEEIVTLETFAGNHTELIVESEDDIWIAGAQQIYHFDGTDWDGNTWHIPSVNLHIFGICLNANGYPIVTGTRLPNWDLDLIYEYIPEVGWTERWQGYEKRVVKPVVHKTRGFAIGARGRIVEHTIFGWQEITSLTTWQINDIVMPDMSRAWAVTDLGQILQYQEASIEVIMNDSVFAGMDPFELNIRVFNPGNPYSNIMTLVILEAYGHFWFWPSWTDTFDCEFIDLIQDHDETMSILSFTWPSSAGSGQSSFWGALLDPDNNILCYDIETFMWTD